MTDKENMKTMIVKNQFNASSSFDFYINVPFDADEMRLSNVSFINTGAGAITFYLKSTLPIANSNDIIGISSGNNNNSINSINCLITYKLIPKSIINGLYTFTALDVNDNLINITGIIQIVFEFVKYKK